MYLFILNPVAGRGRSNKIFKQVRVIFDDVGAAYEVWQTEYKGHATELAKKAVEQGYENIIAVGGDGTVLEVATGLVGHAISFGVIPAGTGNDFVRSIGVKGGPQEAAAVILSGKKRKVDIGKTKEGNYFMNVAGTGFDTEVVRFTERFKNAFRGLLPYLFGLLSALFVYKSQRVKIVMDGKTMERNIFLVAIANGRAYGGGMLVAPKATPFDGKFNITIIDALPNAAIPFILGYFIKGEHQKIKQLSSYTCNEISIETQKHLPINMDGEIIGKTPMTFEVVKNALLMFAPAS